MDTIKEQLPKMMLENMHLIQEMSANKYKDAFDSLYKTYKPVLNHFEEMYVTTEDKQSFIQEIADDFVEKVHTQFENTVKKSNKETLTLDYNMLMTSFAIPCILESRGDGTVELADALVDKWNQTFTRYKIQKGRFTDIDGSFKRKLCYITTAVCDNLGKPDDCYELNLLRDFRDTYMMHTSSGESLVKDYYEIAPIMVMRMNFIKDSRKIYEAIYHQYIAPCITFIEEMKYEECQKKYMEMVQTLKERFIGGHHE